jgi:hypothetical protein
MEPTVKIEFNSQELQALGTIIDVAVKTMGIQGAKVAVILYDKLETAVKEANKPEEAKPEKNE